MDILDKLEKELEAEIKSLKFEINEFNKLYPLTKETIKRKIDGDLSCENLLKNTSELSKYERELAKLKNYRFNRY